MLLINNKIKEIKRKRLSHEVKTIVDTLDNIEEVISIYFPNSIFYKKDNKVIFEKEILNKRLYIDYDYFINIFQKGDGISLDKKMENIEVLINEKIDISNCDVKFTNSTYRSFWNII